MGIKPPRADPSVPPCRRCFLHGLHRGQCPCQAPCQAHKSTVLDLSFIFSPPACTSYRLLRTSSKPGWLESLLSPPPKWFSTPKVLLFGTSLEKSGSLLGPAGRTSPVALSCLILFLNRFTAFSGRT